MSVVPAEDLLRVVAGAAKLERLWLQVGQLFNGAAYCANSKHGWSNSVPT
jgi:hypothetical protein